ncbi:MAG: hypothetical protein M3460_13065 [Actinomycetota bacterium]|nr:hypothetical protein [Actinomycetota bacterium]
MTVMCSGEIAPAMFNSYSRMGRKEVIFGVDCSPSDWQRLIASAVETEYYVAQEVVEFVHVPVRVMYDDNGNSDFIVAKLIVSPFCIGGVSSECHVRMDSAQKIGVVTQGAGALPGCLLGAPV